MSKTFYITTTLPYVNADPHIGTALEFVQADIIARFKKLQGYEVFFNTGTDEHGLKIFRKATEEGKDPQAYVDLYAAKFRQLKEKLGLSPDIHFIRTTDPHHKAAAQEMWKRAAAKGDIYKKKYKGLYCVSDEAFVKESELVNGRCSNHPTQELVEIEEENYFFKLSNYQDKILSYLKKEEVIIPDWRRKEAIIFVEKGLEDTPISREKSRMSWGVPVPDDDTQVMYVWFDALTNYISTLGWPLDKEGLYKKFWENGETLQVAGKDQVRFQSIMWQAMLMSAGLPNTQKIFYHGFVTSGGQKMSKSIGNVVDPLDLVGEYGTEALRHFLARHIHPFEDSDFTMERFKEAYNADLANGIGNLTSRIMKMSETNLPSLDGLNLDVGRPSEIEGALDAYNIKQAADYIWSEISRFDEMIQKEAPFKLVKTDPERGKSIIKNLVQELYKISKYLEPFLPETSLKIQELIKLNKSPKEPMFLRKE
jgi:methionyl-tRNA synthetase